jgi:transcription-repair coupling factor (superfamily II helicase)
MSLNGILSLITDHPEYRHHLKLPDFSPPQPQITVRQGGRPAYIAALWLQQKVPLLVITPRPEDARRLHDQLLTYLGEEQAVYLLPEPEVLPFERLAVDSYTCNQRLAALAALAAAKVQDGGMSGPTPLVVAAIGAALHKTLPPETMMGSGPNSDQAVPYRVGVGERLRLNSLLTQWVDMGYRNEPLVEGPGCFSRRGGIIDVFPPNADLPFRIEMWDDEVDTIRLFDPYSQRSVRSVEEVRIIPAREQLPNLAGRDNIEKLLSGIDFTSCSTKTQERMEDELVNLFSDSNAESLSFYNGLLNQASLLDYLPHNGLVVMERTSRIESEAQELEERFDRMRASREDRGELPTHFPSPYLGWREFDENLTRRSRVELNSWVSAEDEHIFQPAVPYYGRLEQLASDARRYQLEGKVVVAVTQHARRLAGILEEAGAGVSLRDELNDPPQPGMVYLVPGSLQEGWTLTFSKSPTPAEEIHPSAPVPNGEAPPKGDGSGTAAGHGGDFSLLLLTDAELFGTVKERRYRRTSRSQHGPEVALADLVPGSYVVHVDHGVARFDGTTQIGEDGEEKEYLVLEYAEGDKLYVPTEHLDRVSAYVGALDRPPSLTRLSAAEWARVKQRVKGATRELAQELLKLNAARQVASGHEFSPDTTWQQELEDSFPYEETPDQARAINQVKEDMEQPKPMDRLICGDVGYGKTEVALRAAFKSVNDGMQVGLLVPTTVLAQQHYATFSERLNPFPIRLEVLSRFKTAKEQKEVLEGLENGAVDIVIGTHRLLQKDVKFKNLGLAVVDEEQRFGVSHKEQLKKLRQEVDVLTLSATPIPRTLNLALSGIRDLSTMDTPPESRLPVKTFVSEYSEDVIKEAILRELERNGQVYFLHNRVKTIGQTAARIAELVPQAKILIAHGQMAEGELEDVMVAFSNREADVLVCTTIIESGLDMPNVNTLILDRADRFGLAQLYQLRGRVGRGDHRAYAYLLIPQGRRITEAAEQRVQAILEASDLGSGFRIAMRDLEIRGAGNLLGAAQSGHIHQVGLDLYSQLLQEAVRELAEEQGQDYSASRPVAELPRMDLPLQARIPESYIDHLPTRLAIYKRLARLSQMQEIPVLRDELRDRFGPPPLEVENLLFATELRSLAAMVSIKSVTHNKEAIVLTLHSPIGGARAPLQQALGPSANVGNQQVHLPWRGLGEDWPARLRRMLERFAVFQERLEKLVG